MNGAHDLGGMHGFGRINAEPESQEPVFHADWEKRVFGLVRVLDTLESRNVDLGRFARESQQPVDYLRHSYYETWLAGLEKILVESGLVTAEELATGKAVQLAGEDLRKPRSPAETDVAVLTRGFPSTMPADGLPRFRAGDRVRARNRHPAGHTREPRYVRGRVGVIQEYRGTHVFPDLSAEGVRVGRHLYSVRFEASQLWGENADSTSAVYADLWQDYLESV
ncbi:MAG: nitrile hydratase subunit beta [Gemmataceae bacterium]